MTSITERIGSEWLAPTDSHKVATASDATLRRSLLTCDGAGEKIKEAVLDELIRRKVEHLTAFIGTAREKSELVETPKGPMVMVPYWFMRDPVPKHRE